MSFHQLWRQWEAVRVKINVKQGVALKKDTAALGLTFADNVCISGCDAIAECGGMLMLLCLICSGY